MLDIFAYTDYRKFLVDYHRERKRLDPKFSHRFLALQLGWKSSGFFAEVISGKKRLTGAATLKLAKTLKLKKDEAEYFINLVAFNQAETVDEKNRFFEKLMGVSRVRMDVLHSAHFEYFRHWYCAAIRELLAFHPWHGDYRALGKKLNPPISAAQAREAVELMLDLGLLVVDGEGRYLPAASSLSTGEGFHSLNVANFQRACIELARDGIDRHPSAERDYSTLTLPLKRENLGHLRNAVARLRSYLVALSEQGGAPDMVYQVNFQVFPLSR